jgi:rhodanese-related sulfurtransferase
MVVLHSGRSPAATGRLPAHWQNHPMNTVPSSNEPVRPAAGYAGDVAPEVAWQWCQSGDAVLVDVRTDAEREWVGFVPGAVPLAWKQWPGMQVNAQFDEGLRAAVPAGKKVVLLCRSGVRSIAAARRATELGLQAYNILEGFEGDADAEGHRGRKGGWRLRGLPWRQN